MRITICGSLTLEEGDVVVREPSFPGRQGRLLWAYMVLDRRRPVGRDELATALWGDETPDAWEDGLNALVSRLRAALRPFAPDVALHGSVGRYRLELPLDAVVDRERAWDAIHHVQAIRRTGDVKGAWAEAVIAHEIASRGLLAGETAPWVEAERRVLRDIELQALEAIAEAELAQGKVLEAEHVARTLVSRDPLRESGYRLLMLALRAGGNGAQAARVMEECRSALGAVGAVPSAATERTFRGLS